MNRRVRGTSTGAASLGILAGISGAILPGDSASATEYWLSGVDPVVQKDRHVDQPADYMEMFKPEAPWSTGAAHLTAFKTSTQFVLRGTEEEVKTLVAGLKARHIGLGIELGLLTYSDRCGKATEGYGAPLAVETVAKRLASFGGQLDYVAIDEPVTWGHAKTGVNKGGFHYCEDSVVDLVDQIAPKVALLQHYFPNVKFGEIDGINGRFPHLPSDIIEFMDELHKKTGVKPSFFHADVAWDSKWQAGLEDVTQRLRSRGIAVGVVCDGDGEAASDTAWANQAIERCLDVAHNPKTRPEIYVVQSWQARPKRTLPETEPGTLTYILKEVEAGTR